MKKRTYISLCTFAAFAFNAHAQDATVAYECQQDKAVSVQYAFNKQGEPKSASVKVQGKQRTLTYDAVNSDDVSTTFIDRDGYILSTSAINARNYREAAVVITSPQDEMLYKSCMPKKAQKAKAKSKEKAKAGGNRVSYQCQNNRRLTVDYRFGQKGRPLDAKAELWGEPVTLVYDKGQSDEFSTVFTDEIYNLTAEKMDAGNFRKQSLSVMRDDGEILYKECQPQ